MINDGDVNESRVKKHYLKEEPQQSWSERIERPNLISWSRANGQRLWSDNDE